MLVHQSTITSQALKIANQQQKIEIQKEQVEKQRMIISTGMEENKRKNEEMVIKQSMIDSRNVQLEELSAKVDRFQHASEMFQHQVQSHMIERDNNLRLIESLEFANTRLRDEIIQRSNEYDAKVLLSDGDRYCSTRC